MPRWPVGGRTTCESCKSIDVRQWHRRGRLFAGQTFSWGWSCGGEPSGSIQVRTRSDAVVLSYGVRPLFATEWKPLDLAAAIRGSSAPSLSKADIVDAE